MTFAFAAAGTGGHIYPALAVARALAASGVPNEDIVFFGGDRLETTAVPDAGFELVQLEVRGLRRSMTADNLKLPGMVRRAAADVTADLERRRPGVLTVFGGYVSVPAAMGARKVGMPYVIHEQNAVPGLANRYVARRAARTLVAFAPALERLPGAEVVGNPLAPAFQAFDRDELRASALERYGLPADRPVIGIFGGSLGALALNEVVPRLVAESGGAFSVLHLTGSDHHTGVAAEASTVTGWATAPFEPEMQYFYAASDLVLSRAGAMTVSELAATATPAIVVPLPAGKGYQARNASDLEQAGGALIVGQDRIAEVPGLLSTAIVDSARLGEMRRAAWSVARPDSATRVAEVLMEVARV
ncbi:MAG: UDP-N-acetylglucosamine--N-acetylmuramyl-(pentapeptide) pyrophosphoryl-undecaprenol N-acetylglucosamine transferase [Actinomycetota bacterium]